MAMRRKLRWQLLGLALLTFIVGGLAYPREGDLLRLIGIDSDLSIRRGLDLQGGVYLVYEAQLPEDAPEPAEVLEQAAAVIRRRVNPGGASEALVQVADNNRLVVQLPDVDDPAAAIELIGQTARLEFFEVNTEAEEPSEQLVSTQLSGQDIANAEAGFDQFNRPVVNLRFKPGESTEQFAELTTRVNQSGTQLLTLLDGQVVFGPAGVQQPILNGESQLSGSSSLEEAQATSTLLNAGALPVPITLAAQQTIGPTLGAESLSASLVAGTIGLICLIVFLGLNYRLGGAVAVTSLLIYAAANVAVFKLSTLPLFGGYTIVLSLAGIAGFIMSVAVAADANILVLERLREERAAGLHRIKAVEAAFRNAWSSIRDASVASLILCFVLYYLASRFGESSIQGFALVLGLGVVLNIAMVTLIMRTLLRGLARSSFGERL